MNEITYAKEKEIYNDIENISQSFYLKDEETISYFLVNQLKKTCPQKVYYDFNEQITNIEPFNFFKMRNNLFAQLETENKSKNFSFTGHISKKINQIIDAFAKMKNYLIGLELIHDYSIFFTLLDIDMRYEIHYEFFIENAGKQKEVLFTVYKYDDCIEVGWDNIENSLIRINNLLELNNNAKYVLSH